MNDVNFPIDFVVTWVNGNDEKWAKKKNQFEQGASDREKNDEISENRYREFGLFKYWFRGVQKNAEWVHKIYVVTDHQVPSFIDTNNSKIVFVNHSDIIDDKYLPTFDSNTIDWHLFKIPNLVEHFVYFNDDFYINHVVHKEDFFTAEGKARDTVGQSIIMPIESYDHTLLNNTMKINQLFEKKGILKQEKKQFFSIKQGAVVFALNVLLSPLPRFTRLYDAHTAYSLLKTDMKDAYKILGEDLQHSFQSKFRGVDDYSIQFVRYFQIVNSHTKSRSMFFGQTVNSNDPHRAEKLLKKNKVKILNINDVKDASNEDLDKMKELFQCRFAEKSVFEKR